MAVPVEDEAETLATGEELRSSPCDTTLGRGHVHGKACSKHWKRSKNAAFHVWKTSSCTLPFMNRVRPASHEPEAFYAAPRRHRDFHRVQAKRAPETLIFS
eukprot:scaffold80_cov325-Pavlova_lutheri.AAC.21